MQLSANLIKSFNSLNSFTFGDWAIRANEPNTLFLQLVDLDQEPCQVKNTTSWPGQAQSPCPNALRYIPGQGVGATPVVVTVIFPALGCNSAALTIVATAVSASDASLYKVDLTALQVPGSGNVIFSVQEGSVTRKFFVMDGISVLDVSSLGQC
jgi:hypothetical protein